MNTSALLHLPAFPPVAAKLLSLASLDETSTAELTRLIRSDAALSADIIRYANSPLFALRAEVHTLEQAVRLLGVRKTWSLALAGISRTYLKGVLMLDELRSYWRYTVACALLAEQIGPLGGVPADTAYAAALFHDIGCLGLMMAFPAEYPRLLQAATAELAEGRDFDLLEEERCLFGIDRYEAGACLARKWNLPGELRAAAGRYETGAAEQGLIGIVLKACRLANTLGFAMVVNPRRLSYAQILETFGPDIASRFPRHAEDLCAHVNREIGMLDWDACTFEPESAARMLLTFGGQNAPPRAFPVTAVSARPIRKAVCAGVAILLLALAILKLFGAIG